MEEIEELLEAILRRLKEPTEVSITIHVINEAPVKLVLTPQTPEINQ